jgi:cob(I)alamin adenosyltransferase
MSKGLIHVYTGDGKGKTTAAIGLAMRSTGQGKKVLILQFLKSKVKDAGEITIARKSGIKVITFKDQISPLFDPGVKRSDLKNSIKEALAISLKKIESNLFDLIVMDEFNTLVSNGYTTISDAKKIIEAKPERVELVLTGRGAPEELMEIADYVTEIRMIKHPFEKGVKARKGIEF